MSRNLRTNLRTSFGFREEAKPLPLLPHINQTLKQTDLSGNYKLSEEALLSDEEELAPAPFKNKALKSALGYISEVEVSKSLLSKRCTSQTILKKVHTKSRKRRNIKHAKYEFLSNICSIKKNLMKKEGGRKSRLLAQLEKIPKKEDTYGIHLIGSEVPKSPFRTCKAKERTSLSHTLN
jgi:hypothetical protein